MTVNKLKGEILSIKILTKKLEWTVNGFCRLKLGNKHGFDSWLKITIHKMKGNGIISGKSFPHPAVYICWQEIKQKQSFNIQTKQQKEKEDKAVLNLTTVAPNSLARVPQWWQLDLRPLWDTYLCQQPAKTATDRSKTTLGHWFAPKPAKMVTARSKTTLWHWSASTVWRDSGS